MSEPGESVEPVEPEEPTEPEETVLKERELGPWGPRHLFGVDLRSLAALRIGYALIILGDLFSRSQDLVAHYTDFGVLPRQAFHQHFQMSAWFSFHLANGSATFIALLFLVNAALAVCLLVGYRTRLVGPLCWLFLVSLQTRNPMVLNGGDVYLRSVLFWALFTPWEAVWSVDSRLSNRFDSLNYRYFSVATAAYALQVAAVYWFAAIPKWDPLWTVNYGAAEIALGLDQFTTPLGFWFREQAAWLPLLTMLVWFFEAYGPFLLFLPYTRILAVVGLMGLHFGFMTSMRLGCFGWIGLVSVFGLAPGWIWPSRLNRAVSSGFQRLTDWLFPESQSASEKPFQLGPTTSAFLLFLILYMGNWNMINEKCRPRIEYPDPWKVPAQMLRLDQRWNMFSPKPLADSGWFIFPARRRSSPEVDLWTGRPPTEAKPDDVSLTYKNQRWRKYFMNIWDISNEKHRLLMGQYLCRSGNAGVLFQDQIVEFEIVFMRTPLERGKERTAPERISLWRHYCFESDIPRNTTPKKEGNL